MVSPVASQSTNQLTQPLTPANINATTVCLRAKMRSSDASCNTARLLFSSLADGSVMWL